MSKTSQGSARKVLTTGLYSLQSIPPMGIPTRMLRTLAATTSRYQAVHFVKRANIVAHEESYLLASIHSWAITPWPGFVRNGSSALIIAVAGQNHDASKRTFAWFLETAIAGPGVRTAGEASACVVHAACARAASVQESSALSAARRICSLPVSPEGRAARKAWQPLPSPACRKSAR